MKRDESGPPALSLHGIPRDATGPVFREPWEAQAFALVVALHRAGACSWAEWTALLGKEINAAAVTQQDDHPPIGVDYYRQWLAALEKLVVMKHLTTASFLAARRRAWERAALGTPHGKPIELGSEYGECVKSE